MTTSAVIVAGGNGSRLGRDVPKPLVQLGDKRIIEHVVENAARAGITRFAVVTRYLADRFPPVTDAIAERLGVTIGCVNLNERFRGDPLNESLAASVLRGHRIGLPGESRFVLLMGDHVGDDKIVAKLRQHDPGNGMLLAVEPSEGRTAAELGYGGDSLSKVFVDDRGLIRCVGKRITRYNGFDTGFFHVDGAVTRHIEDRLDRLTPAERPLYDLQRIEQELAELNRMRAVNIGRARWRNVNTPDEFRRAEEVFGGTPVSGPRHA
jgi:choline kinase